MVLDPKSPVKSWVSAGSAEFGTERERKTNFQWLETAAVRRKMVPETFCMLRRRSIRYRIPSAAGGGPAAVRFGCAGGVCAH